MKTLSIRAVVLTTFLLFAASLHAQQRTDVLVMKNGDRLTCEIMELNASVLYVKLDYVDGTISLNWSQVVRLESNRMLIVKTQNGSAYTGRLSTVETPDGQPIKIQVAETPEKKVVIDSSQIVRMERTSERFWQRFNGDIGIGLIYAKGNQSTQYDLNSSAEYKRERWSAQASFNSTLSSSNGASTTTRNELDLSSLRLLRRDNYFYQGATDFLQSSTQGIGLQTTIAGGIGRYLKNTSRARISVLGGIAWQRTNYTDPSTSQKIATAVINTEVKLFKFKKTNFNLSATLFPAISEPGRVYFKTKESYYIKILSNLSWNISFYGNWDNRPPRGLSGSDYGSSSGLSWIFGK